MKIGTRESTSHPQAVRDKSITAQAVEPEHLRSAGPARPIETDQ
jgi:hypothetical protein